MTIVYNTINKKGLRRMLRQDSTKPEQVLWSYVRANQLGIKFRRQYSVWRYILDFYAPNKKLCIEIDGRNHFSEEWSEYDEIRTEYLESLWTQVLRFTNEEVMNNIDGVLEIIQSNL